jgi:hypothetical protein
MTTTDTTPARPKTYTRQTYPWGLYARNGHRALCSDGVIRAVEMAETADTFFSVPARARISGRWISGYVTTDERESDGAKIYTFRQHDGHGSTLPEWPESYTPERAALLALA